MIKKRHKSLTLMLICTCVSVLWGISAGNSVRGGTLDFQGVYYGTRCLLQGCDPYNESALERVYRADGGEDPSESMKHRRTVTLYVNLPTAFPYIAPFATMPWGLAHWLWAGCVIICTFAGVVAMWDFASPHAPGIALIISCVLLANSEVLFGTANTAGIVVGLCLVAVWCFIKNRCVAAGILCFAVSLAIKPHDTGFVWLYFILAGGPHRKRALQSLVVTVVMGLAAIAWVSSVAPHWASELRGNLAEISGPGGLNEPGPSSLTGHTAAMVIDLQAGISVLQNDPRIYNPVSYAISGTLLIVWIALTVASKYTEERAWLALAAISSLSMLVTYHRPYDAKLLLLALPACAMLWANHGKLGWAAFLLTSASVLLTSDIPLAILLEISRKINLATWGPAERLCTLVLTRPASVILFGFTIFYLWIYFQRTRNIDIASSSEENQPATLKQILN